MTISIKKYLSFLLIIFIFPLQNSAQKINIKTKFKEAEESFVFGEKLKTYNTYLEILEQYPDNSFYNYKMGITCFFIPQYRSIALNYFDKANKLVSSKSKNSFKETKAPIETWYYIGMIHHLNYYFDSAIVYLNKFIEYSNDKFLIEESNYIITACKNGLDYLNAPLDLMIMPVGSNINSEYDDHSPAISGDMKTLIFTSRRKGTGEELLEDEQYFEDIYISHYKDEQWTEPTGISRNINTDNHEASVGLSTDGTSLFIYQGINGGDIYISNFDGISWSIPEPLGEEINSKYKESHVSISIDKKELFFSSNRKGGFGGMDIYKSILREDGTWGKAKNLGEKVNSEYNEDSPYLVANDSALFFSSDRPGSIGGFDIFRTRLNKNGNWSKPENIGYPINSPDDDLYYIESQDGKMALYTSNQSGLSGDINLYSMFLPESEPTVAVISGGIVPLSKENVLKELKISVVDVKTGDTIQTYYPDEETGLYTLILPTNTELSVVFESYGYLPQIQNVFITNVSEYRMTNGVIVMQPVILGQTGQSYHVSFNESNSELTKGSEFILQNISNSLNKFSEIRAEIHIPENDLLYTRRRNTIYNYLIKQKVDSSQVSINSNYSSPSYEIFVGDTTFFSHKKKGWDIKFIKNTKIETISKHKLKQIVFFLKKDTSKCVEIPAIIGDTSSTTRANTLFNYLLNEGIDSSQILVWNKPEIEEDFNGNTNLILTERYFGAQTMNEIIIDTICNIIETEIIMSFFKYNKFESLDIDNILNMINRLECQNITITLAGHTDGVGSQAYNYNLGLKRAEFIKSILLKNNISETKIIIISFGELNPIEPNSLNGYDNPDGREKNRRVEIILEPKFEQDFANNL